MKKLLMILMSLVLGLCALAGCGGGNTDPVKSDIAYYAVIDGAEPVSVPQEALKEDASYPKEYTEGKALSISPLKDSYAITIDGQEGVMVCSVWYTDIACTQEFNGITVETKGNIKLYSKFTSAVNYTECTITYKAVMGNEVVDIPSVCFEKNGNYPTTYVEGIGVSISDLKVKAMQFETNGSGTDYDFKGWFTNSSCTTAFTGIDANARGDITIYAKIAVAYYTPTV